MANPGKNKAPTSNTQEITDDFDWSSVLPEGYSADDFKVVGSRTPIYAMNRALEEKWIPLVGKALWIQKLDMGKTITDLNQRFRDFLFIEYKGRVPTKAVANKGDDGEQEIIEVRDGDIVMLPMSGNIKNIDAIKMVANDTQYIYMVAARPTGTMKLNQPGKPSPMIVVEFKIHPKGEKREGRYLQPSFQGAPALASGGGVTGDGQVYDRDGVVQERIVNAPAS